MLHVTHTSQLSLVAASLSHRLEANALDDAQVQQVPQVAGVLDSEELL